MFYSANQYNYATPLSSVSGLIGETNVVNDRKYFTLSDNVLDGSYYPITGDVGLWGNEIPDENGNLSVPYILTIESAIQINAISLTFSRYAYPVDFSIELYSDAALLYRVEETNNDSFEYIKALPDAFDITHYVVTISKISSSKHALRLYSVYHPWYVHSFDTLSIMYSDTDIVTLDDGSQLLNISDMLRVGLSEVSTIHNIIDKTQDTLHVKHNESYDIINRINIAEDTFKISSTEKETTITNVIGVSKDDVIIYATEDSIPTNVHTRMKDLSRRVYGKAEITYIDPMLNNEAVLKPITEAYNSNINQLFDSVTETDSKFFTLYDNKLDGSYYPSDAYSQVGWTSGVISNADGIFEEPVGVIFTFVSRPIISFSITFDDSHNNLVKDFVVIFTQEDGNVTEVRNVDNNSTSVDLNPNLADVVSIQVIIERVARPYYPATILDMPILSSILYKGYEEESQIMSIDMFEELSYEDEVEMLGGVSANEITLVLDNSNRDFFFNSGSIIAKQLKRNRKIVAWLGTEILPGEIEWYSLGTFWSYKWDVPVNGLTATVVGFDTIGLLGNSPFTNHQTQIGKSIGFLIEYVLNDAKAILPFIEYVIDESLYDVVIPYAWFENSNHAAALRKISQCYPIHIYCDRLGRICAKPHKLHLDYFYDTWSESTNIIDTSYSSLYTALPNVVNVTVHNPVIVHNSLLVESDTPFTIAEMPTNVLNFSMPYLDNINVQVDCDDTVFYNYEVYSWGIIINFVGSGTIRNIACYGDGLDTSSSSVLTKQDSERIKLEGAVTRDIDSVFIQSFSLAKLLLNRFFELLETDIYDATVTYRGDIALSIHDPIMLQESIAPDIRYNIKRHQLSWNGALTGSAELNT